MTLHTDFTAANMETLRGTRAGGRGYSFRPSPGVSVFRTFLVFFGLGLGLFLCAAVERAAYDAVVHAREICISTGC